MEIIEIVCVLGWLEGNGLVLLVALLGIVVLLMTLLHTKGEGENGQWLRGVRSEQGW